MEVYQETWSHNYQLCYLTDNILLVIQAVYQSVCRQEFIWRNCLGKVFFMSLEREREYIRLRVNLELCIEFFDRHHMQGEILTRGAQGAHEQCVRQVVWEDYKSILGKLENASQALPSSVQLLNTKESSSIFLIHFQIICLKAVNLTLHDSSEEWNHLLMYKVIASHFSPP